MFNYPVLLNLANMSCLIVGGGPVGVRKAQQLLEAGAKRVVLVAPSAPAEAESRLGKFSAFTRCVRKFDENDLSSANLVFAVTNDLELNRNIACQCAAKGILCNDASSSASEENGRSGNFSVPASFKSAGLHIAVGAASAQTLGPALSKRICDDLYEMVEQRYGKAVELMSFARSKILALNLPKEPRHDLLIGLAELSLKFNEAGLRSLTQIMQTHLPLELAREIESKLLQLKKSQG